MKLRMSLNSAATATARTAGWTALGVAALMLAVPAQAQYNQRIGNDMGKCSAGAGPNGWMPAGKRLSVEAKIR